MNKKLVISFFAAAFFLLLASAKADACKCAWGGTPCSAFASKQGVIFTGTVTEVIHANEKYGQEINGKVRKIKVSVDEIFKGTLPSEITTSDDGYMCDNFPFKLGESYLIYGSDVVENTQNIVKVGLCSGTRLLSNADEHLRFLRPLREGRTFSTVYGKVERHEKLAGVPNPTIAGIKVRLLPDNTYRKPTKKEKFVEVWTDENGTYSFDDISPGVYQLKIDLPSGLWTPEQRNLTVGIPSCQNRYFGVLTDGRISGKVFNFDGTPARLVYLIARMLDKNPKYYPSTARTDLYGNYTFLGLPEGKYHVSVGLSGYRIDNSKPSPFELSYPYSNWYFPGVYSDKQAVGIDLAETEKRRNVDLKMPPYPVRQTVTGIVTAEDGTPVKANAVFYRPIVAETSSFRYSMVDDAGIFSFPVFEDFNYEIYSTKHDQRTNTSTFSERIILKKGSFGDQLKLVLKPAK